MNIYVCKITSEEVSRLREYLISHNWELKSQDYAYFRAIKEKINIVAYNSGKLTVQGKGFEEFVEFELEPEILHNYGFNLPTELNLTIAQKEADLTPHIGIDESGKGDFFGPLAVCGVYINEEIGTKLIQLGVKDSKTIKSDKIITNMAKEIRTITQGNFSGLILMPKTYNRLYDSFANLNKLLAWGHARVIENVLEKVPDCPRAFSDKFTSMTLMRSSLLEKGRKIIFEQETKAESDVAVAAASILARDLFIRGMQQISEFANMEVPRGANNIVKACASKIYHEKGIETLNQCVKMHFKTYNEIINKI